MKILSPLLVSDITDTVLYLECDDAEKLSRVALEIGIILNVVWANPHKVQINMRQRAAVIKKGARTRRDHERART